MSVYDKELIINGEAVRSPEQQVYKNMKDIKALQEIIKKMYKTSETLTDASVSVAIADTNAPEGTTEGWLITEDGLLFSITGGDDTNLLLAFYSDLKGPQGEEGPEGPGGDPSALIDDNSESDTKTWSSQKIASVLPASQYVHYVTLEIYDNNMTKDYAVIFFTIKNNDEEAFNYTKLKSLVGNISGENATRNIRNGAFSVNGFYDDNGSYSIEGITMGNYNYGYTNDTLWFAYTSSTSIAYVNIPEESNTRYTFTWKDTIKAL